MRPRYWTCSIGPTDQDALPSGSDAPMRRAVEDAFEWITGTPSEFCASGWGQTKVDAENAMEGGRLFTELESAQAYIARVQGAAVPFVLSDAEGVALGRSMGAARLGASWAENHLGDALRRCMADLSFAQEQHAAACDRASEATMRAATVERDLNGAPRPVGLPKAWHQSKALAAMESEQAAPAPDVEALAKIAHDAEWADDNLAKHPWEIVDPAIQEAYRRAVRAVLAALGKPAVVAHETPLCETQPDLLRTDEAQAPAKGCCVCGPEEPCSTCRPIRLEGGDHA